MNYNSPGMASMMAGLANHSLDCTGQEMGVPKYRHTHTCITSIWIKSRRMRTAGHVACTGETKCIKKFD